MKIARMRQVLMVMMALSAGLWLAGWFPASAASITATLTADNHYGLYYGAADGSGLTLAGRNEFGDYDGQGYYNWGRAETWTANNVPAGSYLYVLAWNDASLGGDNPQAWLGDFTLPGGSKLYSTVNDWQYLVSTNQNPHLANYNGIYNGLPPDAQVQGEIATATANNLWASPNPSVTTPNGGNNIWTQYSGVGAIGGISTAANWIWYDTFAESSSSANYYAIFRTDSPVVPLSFNQGPVVPLPSTLLLVGSSLLGLFVLGRRKFKKAGN